MMLNILTQRGFPKLEHRLLSMYSLFIFFLLIFNIGAIIAPRIQCVSIIWFRVDVLKVVHIIFVIAMKTYAHFSVLILKLMSLVVGFCHPLVFSFCNFYLFTQLNWISIHFFEEFHIDSSMKHGNDSTRISMVM